MLCVKMIFVRSLFFVLSAFAIDAYASEAVHCPVGYRDLPDLRSREGEWIKKSLWERFKTAKSWRDLNGVDISVASVTVPVNGRFSTSFFGWHEGINSCIKFSGNQLWVTTSTEIDYSNPLPGVEALKPSSSSLWEGPYIRIGPAYAAERLVFQGVFGNKCLLSDKNESWCFGPGYMLVNEHLYSAELVLDTTELANGIAFSVAVTNKSRTDQLRTRWYFLGTEDGWNVFDEADLIKAGNSKDGMPLAKPWRVLRSQRQ